MHEITIEEKPLEGIKAEEGCCGGSGGCCLSETSEVTESKDESCGCSEKS